MASNVEIKARAGNWQKQWDLARALADGPVQILHQEDHFFEGSHGRLKLRILAPDKGHLIAYDRPDRLGPKTSSYEIFETNEPCRLHEVLARGLAPAGTVNKKRTLFLVGQTRIHLDEVEGLGRFLELEVVLRPGQSERHGQDLARDLMRRLEIEQEDLIDTAYVDLMRGRGHQSG